MKIKRQPTCSLRYRIYSPAAFAVNASTRYFSHIRLTVNQALHTSSPFRRISLQNLPGSQLHNLLKRNHVNIRTTISHITTPTHSALPNGNNQSPNSSPGGVPFKFHVPTQTFTLFTRLYSSTLFVSAAWTESEIGSNRTTGR